MRDPVKILFEELPREENKEYTTGKTILHALRFHDSFMVGPGFTVERDDRVAMEMGRRIYRFERYVYSERLAQDYYSDTDEKEFPTSPWQFFKQRHADSWWLGWLVRRRPVRTDIVLFQAKVKVDRYVTYPDLRIREDQLGRPVLYDQVDVEGNFY